jgi:O-glycosyl hydrolase
MARVMHYELTLAGASTWQWWLGVSPYDYNDGLVYIDHDQYDGEIYESKKLWVMGNFSRFIRPGAVRLDVVTDDGLNDEERAYQVMVSAYRNTDDSIAVVAVNYSESERELLLNLEQLDTAPIKRNVYTTSEETDLKKTKSVDLDKPVRIPARSVVTIVTGS